MSLEMTLVGHSDPVFGLAVTRRANELLEEQVTSPTRRFEAVAVIVSEGLPVQTA